MKRKLQKFYGFNVSWWTQSGKGKVSIIYLFHAITQP